MTETGIQPPALQLVTGGSPTRVAVRVPDRPLEIALRAVLEHHGFGAPDGPANVACEVVTSPGAAADSVPTVLLVDPSPLRSQLAMGAMAAGRVDAVVAGQCIDDLPFVLEALLERGLSLVSSLVRRRARLLPPLTKRQHMLLTLVSGAHVKHERACRLLACSPTTFKREVRQLRESLGLGSRHELPQYARSMGYSPELTAADLALLHDGQGSRPEDTRREGLR